jgi:subtilisin family serine protease
MRTLKLTVAGVVMAGLALLLLGVFSEPATTTAAPNTPKNVFVVFNRAPGPAEEALVRNAGGSVKYTYSIVPAIAATVPESAIRGLSRNPNVTLVEPDIEMHAIDFTAELNAVWGVRKVTTAGLLSEGKTGAGIKVGILDSGIDRTHKDLAYDESCSFATKYSSIQDGNGHGTHVAGTVAGKRDGVGVVGVAPDVTLCVFKVLSDTGSGSYSDMVSALNWISTYNAANPSSPIRVTNHSYGSSGDPGTTVKAAYDKLYNEGVLHIAATGNSGTSDTTASNCIFPARYASLVATAATTSTDARASFSSTCAEVEVAAPGSSVYSTYPYAKTSSGYATLSGTSMASPHAAGVAAVVWAENPGLTNAQVRKLLGDSAKDLGTAGRDNVFGFGLVQTGAALTLAADGASPTPTPTPTSTPTPTPTTSSSTATPTPTATATPVPANVMSVTSITYALKSSTLEVTVTVRDSSGKAVSSAAVNITVRHENGTTWTATGNTNSSGVVKFSLRSAPKGTYTSTINSVTKSGWTWDGITPTNVYTKTK